MPPLFCTLFVLTALALAGCAQCDAVSCASGCCSTDGVCYDGTSVKGGKACIPYDLGDGGFGGGTGGGGGNTAGLAPAADCSSGGTCCSQGGASYQCINSTCQRSDCVSYNKPCNATLLCCADYPTSTSGTVCAKEHCTFCYKSGHECTPNISTCCPGLGCLLKPGFQSVYECR